MPGKYRGPPLVLYRGAEYHEWHDRSFGFSWSLNVEHARRFAVGHFQDAYSHAVLMQTKAPAKAVLLIRGQDNFTDDEAEVVVDPALLGDVTQIGEWTGYKRAIHLMSKLGSMDDDDLADYHICTRNDEEQ